MGEAVIKITTEQAIKIAEAVVLGALAIGANCAFYLLGYSNGLVADAKIRDEERKKNEVVTE